MVERFEHADGIGLRLAPNRSLSWHGNVVIFCILALIAATVAVVWSLAGAWLILPFAGLEITFLAYGLWYTSRQCHRQEVLILEQDTVRLESGIGRKEQEWEMPRRWVRVMVTAPAHGFAVPRLHLVFRDQEVALARFLNAEDQKVLLEHLERSGLRVGYRDDDA